MDAATTRPPSADLGSRIAAPLFHRILDRVDRGLVTGAIEAELPDGTRRLLGGNESGPFAAVRVVRWRAKPAFARALSTFERHPTLFVFAFRFLYGLRTVSPVAIGTTRLPLSRFALLNGSAALLWATIFVSIGYWFGHGLSELIGRWLPSWQVLAGGGIAIVLLGGLTWWWRRR